MAGMLLPVHDYLQRAGCLENRSEPLRCRGDRHTLTVGRGVSGVKSGKPASLMVGDPCENGNVDELAYLLSRSLSTNSPRESDNLVPLRAELGGLYCLDWKYCRAFTLKNASQDTEIG